MDFGKLFNVDRVDFSLPVLDSRSSFLKKDESVSSKLLYFGAPVWTCPAWKGEIYPRTFGAHHELFYYSKFFNSIELNASFYRTPDLSSVTKWTAQVSSGFKFCPKISKEISHSTSMDRIVRERILHEIRSLSQFGDFLGPSFLQLPEWVGVSEWGRVQQLIRAFPRKFRWAIEFRHASWFEGRRLIAPVFEELVEQSVTALITDVAGRRDVSHCSLATDTALVRFVGNALHPSDYLRIEDWSDRLKQWREGGVREIYFFIHEPESILVPEATKYFLEKMGIRQPGQPLKEESVQLSLI